jgi:Tol biopolymer transport system component
LVATVAAGLVVAVASASAYGTVRDFLFGARRTVTWGAPTWSPDGRRIAFLSTTCLPGRPPLCESPSKLVVVGLDGRAQRELSQEPLRNSLGDPVLSPDWQRIAFVRDRGGLYRTLPDGTSWHYSDLVVANVDGSRRRIVAPRGVYEDPVWSPDGRKLAFVRLRSDNAELYVVAADGTGRRKLAHAVSYVTLDGNPKSPNPNPAWSPDGRRIAFTSNRDGNEDIYVVDVDGGGLVNLTRSRGTDRRPVWSPDGRQIAFRGDRDGNGEVYVMAADGSAQRRLTRNPAPDNGAVWSPDGRRILFQRALRDIWVMNRDGSGQRNLTPDVRPARIAADTSPAWSPDGRLIAFLSERDNTPKVYVMTAAGGEPAALGEFVDKLYAVGRISRSAGGVRFSLSVPRTDPQWENGPVGGGFGTFRTRSLRISRSLVRGQAAEVVVYWTAFPGGGQVAPCSKLLNRERGRSIDDLAAVFSKAPGTELVAGPTHATVGGRPARRLELVVREDLGCQPGYLFAWREPTWASFWGTEEGDRIRAWIVDVDGRRLVFVAETKEGFNHPLRPPPSKLELQRAGREIQKIIDSIRFD